MKHIIALLIIALLAFSGCKARYSFNSYDGKKKLKHYNTVQYGKKLPTNTKKRNK